VPKTKKVGRELKMGHLVELNLKKGVEGVIKKMFRLDHGIGYRKFCTAVVAEPATGCHLIQPEAYT
jgi:hypothetical protein